MRGVHGILLFPQPTRWNWLFWFIYYRYGLYNKQADTLTCPIFTLPEESWAGVGVHLSLQMEPLKLHEFLFSSSSPEPSDTCGVWGESGSHQKDSKPPANGQREMWLYHQKSSLPTWAPMMAPGEKVPRPWVVTVTPPSGERTSFPLESESLPDCIGHHKIFITIKGKCEIIFYKILELQIVWVSFQAIL